MGAINQEQASKEEQANQDEDTRLKHLATFSNSGTRVYIPGDRQAVAQEPRMQVLAEREKTHGDFLLVSKVAQDIKIAIQWAPKEQELYIKEALDLIATKIARIVIGNSKEIDHWKDIQGYAGLVLEQIQNKKA